MRDHTLTNTVEPLSKDTFGTICSHLVQVVLLHELIIIKMYREHYFNFVGRLSIIIIAISKCPLKEVSLLSM